MAKMKKPDLRKALIQLAKKRGIKTVTVPRVMKGTKFFDDYVVGGLGIIDPELAVGEQNLHGEMVNLIQDLVVDKKLGAGTSSSFRKLLGQAEGKIERLLPGGTTPSKFGAYKGPNVTFILRENETAMKTGDYVWRWTYDLFYVDEPLRRMPQPEAIGPVLEKLFGLK